MTDPALSDPAVSDLAQADSALADSALADFAVSAPAADGPAVPADPSSLPLFAAAAGRPGRSRSSFTMHVVPAGGDGAGTRRFSAVGTDARLDQGRPVVSTVSRTSVDWALVGRLRGLASTRLSAELGEQTLDRDAQRELGRSVVLTLLREEAAARLVEGHLDAWTVAEHDELARAVFDALFGLGRLQPLVDDPRVENIIITGHDTVWLELSDGTRERGPGVAETDQDLVEFLVFLASRSEVNARPFSPGNPRLHLRLDDGSRLAASAWVTARPSVVVRRHGYRRVSLDDLVGLGSLTPLIASFLSAAVKTRRNIVVAGPQGAGKTTLVRALCAEIPPDEPIGTFETEYELHLHEMPDRHPIVHAWEARPGSGERGADGRQAGEFTLSDALYDSFRFALSRQIVGEVRGPEALVMLKAMESGTGSISTTHAADAQACLRKLVTCAMEVGPHITHDYAARAVAESIHLVVQLHLRTVPAGTGKARRDRWVSEIIAVTPGEDTKKWATTHVFRSPARGGPALAQTLPDDYRDLERFGFRLAEFQCEADMS